MHRNSGPPLVNSPPPRARRRVGDMRPHPRIFAGEYPFIIHVPDTRHGYTSRIHVPARDPAPGTMDDETNHDV